MTKEINENGLLEPTPNGVLKSNEKQKKNAKDDIEELSEEDQQLKDNLDLMVERILSNDMELAKVAISIMLKELNSSTNSLTSVPKPLKFLGQHYENLTQFYKTLETGNPIKMSLADVMSLLSMVYGKDTPHQVLNYRMEGELKGFTSFGHEYTRHVCEDLVAVVDERFNKAKPIDDLLEIVPEITQFYMKSQAEFEAIDLLSEIGQLETIIPYVDEYSINKVVPYILSLSNFPIGYPNSLLNLCYQILMNHNRYPEALRVAMKMSDTHLAQLTFEKCNDIDVCAQMAFMCNWQRFPIDLNFNEHLKEIYFGEFQSKFFIYLASELDVLEPKTPNYVYKKNLDDRRVSSMFDNTHKVLINIYVNAMVNAGFCTDTIMTNESTKGVLSLHQADRLAAVSSLGTILMWNLDELNIIDKFFEVEDSEIKAGAYIAVGLNSANISSTFDLAYGLLSDKLYNNQYETMGAVVGLGFAYAGTNREDIMEVLIPCMFESSYGEQINTLASLSVGLVCVGSCNPNAAEAIIQLILEKHKNKDAKSLEGNLVFVALGLIFLGKKEAVDATLLSLEVINENIQTFAMAIVEGIAYTGSGNLNKVKNMLVSVLLPKTSPELQAVSLICLSLITMGDDIGTDMAIRMLDHTYQNDKKSFDSAPLALALCSISNPQQPIVDTLFRLAHSSNQYTRYHAYFALGIVGAGTNNSRIASLLRQLVSQINKDSNGINMIKIAQGMLHMSKGLVTINPLHSEKFLLNNVSLGGLIILVFAAMWSKNQFLTHHHYFLNYLNLAAHPRMLITVDQNLEPLPVLVRVGQGVDTVGQAGQLKTITGFQTHNTPVLLSPNEKAELATDEYIPLSPFLEGIVILKKNPNYVPETNN